MFSQTLPIDIGKLRSTLSPSISRSTPLRFSIQLVSIEAPLPLELNIFDVLCQICAKSHMPFTALAVFIDLSVSFGCLDEYILRSYFAFPIWSRLMITSGNQLKPPLCQVWSKFLRYLLVSAKRRPATMCAYGGGLIKFKHIARGGCHTSWRPS